MRISRPKGVIVEIQHVGFRFGAQDRSHASVAERDAFFGRMKTEAVYPEKWEEHTRNEVLALVDEYIRWYNHERIKQSLGWMSPVQYRQSQGMAA